MAIIFENHYTMRFPKADPEDVRKAQIDILCPVACQTIGEQGRNTWLLTGGKRRVSFDIVNSDDVGRLADRLEEVDLTSLTGPVARYSYSMVHIVPRDKLLEKAVAMAHKDGSPSHWYRYFLEAEDQALQEIRAQARGCDIKRFAVDLNTQTIDLNMCVTCFFKSDNDRFKFKMFFD